jgi:hypothetical protein
MKPARENILAHGLIDWASLAHVHSDVLQVNRTASPSEVQQKTLDTIRSLVSEGLFELGDLSGEGGRLIYDLCVKHFDNNSLWILKCWLNLTKKGGQVARLPLD